MAQKKPNRLLQGEMLVGLSAVFIGLCALAVSIYEAKLMREEQRSAVLPLLELGRSHFIDRKEGSGDEWRLSLHAHNVGIGPALVKDFRVTVNGQPQATWADAIRILTGTELEIEYGQSTINGRTIPPDRSITMFDLRDTEFSGRIIEEFDRLDYAACFCSVFGECWTTSFSSFGSVTVAEECLRNADSFME